jgi:hypothetical protein
LARQLEYWIALVATAAVELSWGDSAPTFGFAADGEQRSSVQTSVEHFKNLTLPWENKSNNCNIGSSCTKPRQWRSCQPDNRSFRAGEAANLAEQ